MLLVDVDRLLSREMGRRGFDPRSLALVRRINGRFSVMLVRYRVLGRGRRES